MKEPVLVIMAAGMGSRYGGLKQIDPVDEYGNIIIDFSIYDAVKAGFKKAVFIIKKQDEKEFMEVIGNRIAKQIDVQFAYQELEDIPENFTVPEGRVKPWGTGHAIRSIRRIVNSPFLVINADDYYGPSSFQKAYDYLRDMNDTEVYNYVMIGYRLINTMTEHGHVARGICQVGQDGFLQDIQERTRIGFVNGVPAYSEDEGKTWTELMENTAVSMNMWGFTPSILCELEKRFIGFLEENLSANPLKCEFFLPFAVNELLEENRAKVRVLESEEKWYGVTYKEDKEKVVHAIRKLKADGAYPEKLWE